MQDAGEGGGKPNDSQQPARIPTSSLLGEASCARNNSSGSAWYQLEYDPNRDTSMLFLDYRHQAQNSGPPIAPLQLQLETELGKRGTRL